MRPPAFGVTPKIADEFFDWGIDVLTSGNHIWDKKEILPYLQQNTPDPAACELSARTTRAAE